ncbi:MAG: extracellular solute-binding protein, partial [Candidatus Aerophobus sp.]
GGSTFTQECFFPWFWSNGARMFDDDLNLVLNSPEAVEVLKFYVSLKPFAPPGVTTYEWGEEQEAFYAEKVAMTQYMGRVLRKVEAYAPQLHPVTKVVRIPHGKGKETITFNVADVWGIPAKADYPDVAKEFIKFILTGDRYVRWIHGATPQTIPALISTSQSQAYLNHKVIQLHPEEYKILADACLKDKGWIPTAEGGVLNPKGQEVRNSRIIVRMVQEAWIQGVPPEQAVANAEKAFIELVGGRKVEKLK